jgi:hypothetical protein
MRQKVHKLFRLSLRFFLLFFAFCPFSDSSPLVFLLIHPDTIRPLANREREQTIRLAAQNRFKNRSGSVSLFGGESSRTFGGTRISLSLSSNVFPSRINSRSSLPFFRSLAERQAAATVSSEECIPTARSSATTSAITLAVDSDFLSDLAHEVSTMQMSKPAPALPVPRAAAQIAIDSSSSSGKGSGKTSRKSSGKSGKSSISEEIFETFEDSPCH